MAFQTAPIQAYSQLFTKVTTGGIVSTPSGSRSCNFLDLNNDDFQDLLITNGTSGGEDNLLYLNNQDGTFSLLMDTVGSDHTPTDGATCADYNNDGFIDIYAVNWYNVSNLLYLNNGNGSYSQIDTGLIPNDAGYSETAAWGDMDQDGLLDLYVTNSAGTNRNFLYHNQGSGAFQKLSGILPVTDGFKSRSVNWIDIDLDGDQDLYVSNENNQPNNLYRNDGNGAFTKISNDPSVQGNFTSHSSSWADYDNDGDFDLMVANYQQANQLFTNDGAGNFTEVANPFGPDSGCSFSSSFADYDNDGDLDLFVTNGFCSTNIRNYLYDNDGNGTFTRNLTEVAAIDSGGSYGCAWGDIDNDGFMDLAVANWQGETQPNYLYHNNGNGNNWMELKLKGTASNRSAIGTLVRVKSVINGNPVWQLREVTSQSGYCSQNSLVVHFGLADGTAIDSLQVIWPSGTVQNFNNVNPNHLYSLEENGGIVVVGVEEPSFEGPRMEVYPNPNGGDFFIEVLGMTDESYQVEVFDMAGKQVFKQPLMSHSGKVRLSISEQWGTGVYWVKISHANGVFLHQKVSIAHQ